MTPIIRSYESITALGHMNARVSTVLFSKITGNKLANN